MTEHVVRRGMGCLVKVGASRRPVEATLESRWQAREGSGTTQGGLWR
jgi:hypothetical protein